MCLMKRGNQLFEHIQTISFPFCKNKVLFKYYVYCTVLYCVLYCTVMYRTVQYCTLSYIICPIQTKILQLMNGVFIDTYLSIKN